MEKHEVQVLGYRQRKQYNEWLGMDRALTELQQKKMRLGPF